MSVLAGWSCGWLAADGLMADLASIIGCETWLRTARTSLQLLPIVATAGVPPASSSLLQGGWGVGSGGGGGWGVTDRPLPASLIPISIHNRPPDTTQVWLAGDPTE